MLIIIYIFTYVLAGEKTVFNDTEVSIATSLTINGRIFVSPKDHLDAMVTIMAMANRSKSICLLHVFII